MKRNTTGINKKNIIGSNLKLIRLHAKPVITQNNLSAKLQLMGFNIDRTTISKIETGNRTVFDFELKAIAEALNISIDQLLK